MLCSTGTVATKPNKYKNGSYSTGTLIQTPKLAELIQLLVLFPRSSVLSPLSFPSLKDSCSSRS
jgi:hypothetical protein